ncbi:MAG: TetR/AcrR family transcriptional regulator [Gammaproteobacteria bacterium]|nr:TetR/AcrR family transcriptional regulator [Gammaproteobacteria bacterium]
MPRSSHKREQLLNAATDLVYRQGFHRTSLADIAKASEVPLGNVYYYFKTKEDIVQAVMERRSHEFLSLFEGWDKLNDPRARLNAFLEMVISISSTLTEHGCPIGSLCQELGKDHPIHASAAAGVLKNTIAWVSQQYTELGLANAQALGTQFVALLQGAILLANTLGDPLILTKQMHYLKNQIETL